MIEMEIKVYGIPPLGGVKRGIISRMIRKVVEKGGVAEGVLDALESFQ